MSASRIFSSLALGVALTCGSSVASAALEPFCVDDRGLTGLAVTSATGPGVVACAGQGSNVGETGFGVDLLQGSYVEKVKVTSITGPGTGTFAATIVFNANSYSYLGTTLNSFLDGSLLIPGTPGYNLYAVVQATGTFNNQSFAASGATVAFYADVDQDADMSLASISDANLLYTAGGVGDILLGGSVSLLSGSGNLGSSGGTDGFAVLFDSFGLTPAGDQFFIAPRPFHVRLFSDGDITDPTFDPNLLGNVTSLQGEASANFVPEPGSLALVGLTLLGLGAARRRKV